MIPIVLMEILRRIVAKVLKVRGEEERPLLLRGGREEAASGYI